MGIKKINCCTPVETRNKFFPKLMKNKRTGAIGLFTSHDTGTMLIPGPGSTCVIGSWLGHLGRVEPGHWYDYNEPLTLQNE